MLLLHFNVKAIGRPEKVKQLGKANPESPFFETRLMAAIETKKRTSKLKMDTTCLLAVVTIIIMVV
jgi:hypothetical protein